jgi:DNA-binding MarR family transcriptional regulator
MPSEWSFLTNHARLLLCIAHDPGIRLRELAATLGITERIAYGIVTDLASAGYVEKERDGRRNRYRVQHHLPLREPVVRERTIGELLELLVEGTPRERRKTGRGTRTATPTRASAHASKRRMHES